jgi:hypothetical protein
MSSMSQNPCERRIAAMSAGSNRSLRFRELRLAFPAALAILGGRESRVRDAEHSGAGNDSASCKYRASDDERLDAISIEAAESSTPAPNDMMAAMARCGSYAISPSIVPPSTPDAAANPQQKAHTAPVIPSDIACSSSSSPTTLRVQQQTTDIFTELQNHPRASPSVTGAERSVARRETSESGLLRPRHVFE